MELEAAAVLLVMSAAVPVSCLLPASVSCRSWAADFGALSGLLRLRMRAMRLNFLLIPLVLSLPVACGEDNRPSPKGIYRKFEVIAGQSGLVLSGEFAPVCGLDRGQGCLCGSMRYIMRRQHRKAPTPAASPGHDNGA